MAAKKLFTVQEACRYLGVSRTTLLKTEEEGLITSMRTVGGHRRYQRETLARYLEATTGLRTPTASIIRSANGRVVLPKVVERLAKSSGPADDIMKEVLQDLIQLLQADAGLIALLDKQDTLRPRVAIGLNIPRALQSEPIALDSTISGKVLKLQHPIVYEDSESNIPFEGLTQGVCAPLVYRGVPLGVIHVLSLSRHQFLPTEVQFLSLVALYLASLIVNAQVLADSRQREEELACLNRLSQVMQQQRNLYSMAEVLLKETLRITKANVGAVLLHDDTDEVHIAASHGLPSNLKDHLAYKIETTVAEVLDSDEPYLHFTFPTRGGMLDMNLSPVLGEMGSLILLPLRAQGEKVGALLLCSQSPRDTNHWQANFLTLVCTQAALVVHRTMLCNHLAQISEADRLLRLYYEKMIEMAPVAMEIIDRDLKIIGWNEAAKELSGITPEEALGADKFLLQPGLLKHNGPEILEEVLETKQVSKLHKFPYERRDGTVRYTDLTFLPFMDDDGEVTAIILFAKDITELEALQSKL